MTSRDIERAWPYLTGLLVVCGWWIFLGAPFPSPDNDLLAASGTVASVLVGFLATAKAILLSIAGSDVYKHIKSIGISDSLFDYLAEAMYFGTALLTVSLIGFFIQDGFAFSALWVFVSSTALSLYIRVLNLIFSLLRKA